MTLRSAPLTVLLTAAAAAATVAAARDAVVDVPTGLATRPLLPDVYGYSIEPVWVTDYTRTPLAATLLGAIANVTGGKPPPIRVGGNTADQTYLHDTLSTGSDSAAIPTPATATQLDVTPGWYDSWADYFPAGTEFVYALNLNDNASQWANAAAEAEAAHAALGDRLVLFELGNEVDHFISKGWRDASSWGVSAYLRQFRIVTGRITGSEWYLGGAAGSPRPRFQAGVFGDPPGVPDQQDEMDDFSVENLTRAERPGDREVIGSYATHLYPQSACDAERWVRMRLDLLSNHTVLWLNVSQYAPQVAAADAAGAPLVMGETNSVSCSGKSGISDTFGAALWGVDYVLTGASLGIQKTYFHLGAQSEYSAFTPQPYELKNETLGPGIRANWYGHYFVAKVTAPVSDNVGNLSIAALPAANTSELSGYAVYAGSDLRKLVFLDMGVWNGTEGLANNATLRATDGTSFSEGERPTSTVGISTPWCSGAAITVTRLTGPGTNAKSEVAVAGVTFDPSTGDKVGEETTETLEVAQDGSLDLEVKRAEGVLLELKAGECAGETEVETSRAAGKVMGLWVGSLMAVITGSVSMAL
ncbi:hypothetical protein GGR53DRAFT_477359 [Hypoxylon sp. FL1150]|nr:hypothetical protein GGR53DRAFT_477359 [Hypoxylon sp. FL1150]